MTTSPDTLIYCFKCKAKTESNDLEQVVLKNRRDATQPGASAPSAAPRSSASASWANARRHVNPPSPERQDD